MEVFIINLNLIVFTIDFTLTLLKCRRKRITMKIRLVSSTSVSRNINHIFNKFVQEKNGDMIAVNCEAVRFLTHSFIKCRNGIDSREAQCK